MKKIKSIEGILKESGLIEELIESFARSFNVDKNIAKKIVQMRMDHVFNKLGDNIREGQYQIKKKDIDSKLPDILKDDIINSENIIKDK